MEKKKKKTLREMERCFGLEVERWADTAYLDQEAAHTAVTKREREKERAALRLLILLPHSPSPQNVPCKLPNRLDYSHRDPSVLRNKIRQGAEKTTFSLENNHLKLCDKSNSSEKHVHMEGLAIVCSTAKL